MTDTEKFASDGGGRNRPPPESQTSRLASGWRRFIETVERQRRQRAGERRLQVVEGDQEPGPEEEAA